MKIDDAVERLNAHVETYNICHGKDGKVAVYISKEDAEALNTAIRSMKEWKDISGKVDKKSEIHNDGMFYVRNYSVKGIINETIGVIQGEC